MALASFNDALTIQVERTRLETDARLEPQVQIARGQFMTPATTAALMASLFSSVAGSVRLLDAGAGVGSLTAAFAERCLQSPERPTSLNVTAFEIDKTMLQGLRRTLEMCRSSLDSSLEFSADVHATDFLAMGLEARGGLFGPQLGSFTHAILNPPYAKLTRGTVARMQLEAAGLDANNLYTAFLDLVIELLAENGELVAITPRSFFNGPYFTNFRQRFLERMSLRHIRVFDSRNELFSGNGVLQETVIFHAIKTPVKPEFVLISSSNGTEQASLERAAPYIEVIRPNDAESFIHVLRDEADAAYSTSMQALPCTLEELGLKISTGKVVDFRVLELLRPMPEAEDHALIYPGHLRNGEICYPLPNTVKANAVIASERSSSLLVPEGVYVLVKRFSAKEERRRVVAALYEPTKARSGPVGFENHLNYIHCNGQGLARDMALGLIGFLNSTAFDTHFRQFSGHTQVNATDLRNMRFPTAEVLERLGRRVILPLPDQQTLDAIVNEEVFGMTEPALAEHVERKIEESLTVLRCFRDLPRKAVNPRSALTLLALLGLKPDSTWAEAERPQMGVTPIMDFIAVHYGKRYAPNSRETFRKDTLHQFLHETLVVLNPDDPARAINSPGNVYQVNPELCDAVKSFGQSDWSQRIAAFLQTISLRREQSNLERQTQRIPVLFGGTELALSPGGQNPLIKRIIEEFCERFAAGAQAVYIGDTDSKTQVFYNRELLESLGVTLDDHGKIPDVIVYQSEKNWLYLIEAVTSHGPMSETRKRQLEVLFKDCAAGLVFVTAFETRSDMRRFLADLAWETEVWIADAPEHLIHFNGDRFLGPHE